MVAALSLTKALNEARMVLAGEPFYQSQHHNGLVPQKAVVLFASSPFVPFGPLGSGTLHGASAKVRPIVTHSPSP